MISLGTKKFLIIPGFQYFSEKMTISDTFADWLEKILIYFPRWGISYKFRHISMSLPLFQTKLNSYTVKRHMRITQLIKPKERLQFFFNLVKDIADYQEFSQQL